MIAEYRPRPPLDRHIRLIWTLEAGGPERFGAPERIVADGIVEVVFHFETPFLTSFAGRPFEMQPRGFAISQVRHHIFIRSAGRSGFIAVRFYPWGACHYFDLPVNEFADGLVETRCLWGNEAVELEERLGLAAGGRERVRLVEEFLLRQARQRSVEDLEPVVRHIWRAHGQAQVRHVARELGLSERQLQRKCEAALGAPPKQVARVTRFLHACRLLRAREFGSLAEVAQACGYYDQSHFIHDFESLAGVAPTGFLAEMAPAAH